jgi:hypothetical protein
MLELGVKSADAAGWPELRRSPQLVFAGGTLRDPDSSRSCFDRLRAGSQADIDRRNRFRVYLDRPKPISISSKTHGTGGLEAGHSPAQTDFV